LLKDSEKEFAKLLFFVPANDAEDNWEIWGTSKKDKAPPLTHTPPTPPEIASVSDPVEDPKQSEVPAASPLTSPSPSASKSVWHPISALSISAAAPTKSTTNNL
jgi:hypothetical protein